MGDKDRKDNKAAKVPLREDVAAIDRQILRLLLKRHNLLEKIRNKGRIETADEIFLREAWQREVARVSKDAELSGRFFSLMQNVGFMPKPAEDEAGKREAFNLAPSREAARFSFAAPLDSRLCRYWLYVAACAGRPISMAPAPQSDAVVDCVQALAQMGGAITREDDALICRRASPLGCPDKALFAGNSEFNFYLILAHYLGRHSRCKILGDAGLQLADFSFLRGFLTKMGARIVYIVPKSSGLPVRLECSGILPASVTATPDLPEAFLQALILAAPFYSRPIGFNLSAHPRRESILARVLPILESCGATFTEGNRFINLQPSGLVPPENPKLPLDPEIACFILGLLEPLGGEGKLFGGWPVWPESTALWNLLLFARLPWKNTGSEISVDNREPLNKFSIASAPEELVANLPPMATPFLTALAVCAASRGGESSLPPAILEDETAADFLRICGCSASDEGLISRAEGGGEDRVWNAPTPGWAMALALVACAREKQRGYSLGNPGIIGELWPSWWTFYNSLPNPRPRKTAPTTPPATKRRRILTDIVAEPPELKDEDL